MVQRGEDFGFALKRGQSLSVGRDGIREYLDGDGPLQVRVGRPYTSPIPPTPIWVVISNGPIREPGASAIAGGILRDRS